MFTLYTNLANVLGWATTKEEITRGTTASVLFSSTLLLFLLKGGIRMRMGGGEGLPGVVLQLDGDGGEWLSLGRGLLREEHLGALGLHIQMHHGRTAAGGGRWAEE